MTGSNPRPGRSGKSWGRRSIHSRARNPSFPAGKAIRGERFREITPTADDVRERQSKDPSPGKDPQTNFSPSVTVSDLYRNYSKTEVDRIRASLSPDERAHSAVLCANYGEAGSTPARGY